MHDLVRMIERRFVQFAIVLNSRQFLVEHIFQLIVHERTPLSRCRCKLVNEILRLSGLACCKVEHIDLILKRYVLRTELLNFLLAELVKDLLGLILDCKSCRCAFCLYYVLCLDRCGPVCAAAVGQLCLQAGELICALVIAAFTPANPPQSAV